RRSRSHNPKVAVQIQPLRSSSEGVRNLQLRVLVASSYCGCAAVQMSARISENVIVTQTRVRIPFGHQLDRQSEIETGEEALPLPVPAHRSSARQSRDARCIVRLWLAALSGYAERLVPGPANATQERRIHYQLAERVD